MGRDEVFNLNFPPVYLNRFVIKCMVLYEIVDGNKLLNNQFTMLS